MTAVQRLQLLPAPGPTPGATAVAIPAQGEQQIKPVVPARVIEHDQPQYRRQQPETEQRTGERRMGDRRVSERQAALGHGEQGRWAGEASGGTASGRRVAFSRLSSMAFMVQVLGQQTDPRLEAGTPQTSLSGHRDAALLGSDIYRKAGGEPEFLPETATFVRLAV